MKVLNLLERTIATLRERGLQVEPAAEPWLRLFNVAGYGELTERQLLDLAYRITSSPQPLGLLPRNSPETR